jgi:O-methyltransferase
MSAIEVAGGAINVVLRRVGLELHRAAKSPPLPPAAAFIDLEPWVADILHRVRPYTRTSAERISALCHATQYVARAKIPGDIVECGVWRGGSMMAAALTLLQERDLRTLHLYDTFAGMTEPTEVDRQIRTGRLASELLEESPGAMAYAGLREVRRNLYSTKYPTDRLNFIEGKVEDTIPARAPSRIAILRLDTDWYESTRHELIHLYPRLSTGGVMIIDDYGHFAGSRKATDEFIDANQPIFLNRIDPDARLVMKVGEWRAPIPA